MTIELLISCLSLVVSIVVILVVAYRIKKAAKHFTPIEELLR